MEKTMGIVLLVFLVAGVAYVQVHYYRERQKAKAECERLERSLGQMQKQYADVARVNQSYRQMNHELKKYQWLLQVMRENMDTVTHGQLLELIFKKKKQEAEQKQIVFSVEGSLNGSIRLDEISLVSLVMNLLDNAIEASVQTDRRQITVTIIEEIEARRMKLIVRNSKRQEQVLRLNETENGYITTKEDGELHGYGTQIIRRIVDENGGMIQYEDCGDIMQVTCVLCMDTETAGNGETQ